MRLRAKFAFLIIGMFVVLLLFTALLAYVRIMLAEDQFLPQYAHLQRWIWQELIPAANSNSLSSLNPTKYLETSEAQLVVFDELNQIVLSTHKDLAVGTRVDLSQFIRDFVATNAETRLEIEPVDSTAGQYRIMLFTPMRPGYTFGQTLKQRTAQNYAVGFLILVTLSVMLAGWRVNKFRRSISDLESATRRIAQGDLDFDLDAQGKDEVASLVRSFNLMRSQLKDEMDKRSRFLMAVSHDLKTPLTSISGYLEAIQDGLAGDPQTLSDYIQIMVDKSRVLEDRILELIDYVRMETGEWKMTLASLNLYDFLKSLIRVYRHDAVVLNRSFAAQLRISKTVIVQADRGLLFRALENLLNNAFRYTGESDRITLEAREEADGGRLILTVADSGLGIPAEDLERIFEPLYRGTNSRREQGFGLGLATVKSIINAHGWNIRVCSSDSGSQFEIVLEP